MKLEEAIELIKNYSAEDFSVDIEKITAPDSMMGKHSRNLINKLVGLVKKDEGCYFEIGTHKGGSLYAAAYHNPDVYCIGLDGFKPEYEVNPLSPSIETIARFILSEFNNVTLIRMDQDKFWAAHEVNQMKLPKAKVYLYDGDHSFAGTLLGLCYLEKILDKEAIVLLDDYDLEVNECVRRAVDYAIKIYGDKLELIRDFKKNETYDFGNGFVALSWRNN